MNILRQTAVGSKLLRFLPHVTKCRGNSYFSASGASHHNFVAFGLFALAVVPFILVAPAHADSISIDLDATAVTLQRNGNLYEHTSSLHVHNSNTYGFTLSMNANQPNLVNSKDSTYKIDSVSGTNQKLAADQWGYGMGKNATAFSSVSSATLADITSDNKGSCTSADDCTLYLTLGADIDPKRLPVGSYSTGLTYTATSKPAPVQPSTPSSGGSSSGGSSSGGSSHSSLYDLCESRYPGSGEEFDKWEYCFHHNGDMSGYWAEKCSKEYSGDYDKESYCESHDGDMSDYQTDWGAICRSRYSGSDAEYFDKEQYCESHNGDMSGYQTDWSSVCLNRYPGSDDITFDKEQYCASHQGDMSGYQTDWESICIVRHSHGRADPATNDKVQYCISHQGDMSGYYDYGDYGGYGD